MHECRDGDPLLLRGLRLCGLGVGGDRLRAFAVDARGHPTEDRHERHQQAAEDERVRHLEDGRQQEIGIKAPLPDPHDTVEQRRGDGPRELEGKAESDDRGDRRDIDQVPRPGLGRYRGYGSRRGERPDRQHDDVDDGERTGCHTSGCAEETRAAHDDERSEDDRQKRNGPAGTQPRVIAESDEERLEAKDEASDCRSDRRDPLDATTRERALPGGRQLSLGDLPPRAIPRERRLCRGMRGIDVRRHRMDPPTAARRSRPPSRGAAGPPSSARAGPLRRT